jgi:chemotaxis protein CheD
MTTMVGLAQWRVSRNHEESLCILGLGSAVALCLFDVSTHTAAAAHVMLPNGRDEGSPAKYGATVVPFLLAEMAKAGASLTGLRVALLGGATMLAQGQSALLEIGNRNVATLQQALEQAGLAPAVTDVGGTRGRTVVLAVGSGEITVKVLSQPDQVYAQLAVSEEVSE